MKGMAGVWMTSVVTFLVSSVVAHIIGHLITLKVQVLLYSFMSWQ